jgi:hypothetical protein
MSVDPARLREIALEIAALVAEKNASYGSSFSSSGEFLRLLYPQGMRPEQYGDALLLVRMYDKAMRIANQPNAFGESPWRDLMGYALLGAAQSEGKAPAEGTQDLTGEDIVPTGANDPWPNPACDRCEHPFRVGEIQYSSNSRPGAPRYCSDCYEAVYPGRGRFLRTDPEG